MDLRRLGAFGIDFLSSIFFFVPVAVCIVLLKIDMHSSMLPWLIWGVLFCKDCFGGRSLGKRLLGYQVVDFESSLVARPFKCVLRNLFYPLGIVDWIPMFYHSQDRRLGDCIAKTRVVKYDEGKNEIRWFEAFLAIICVFSVIIFINMLFVHYARFLGLWGLLYQ